MSSKTPIQWCDSTVNPTMGCDGCELWKPSAGVQVCYAGRLHNQRPNPGFAPVFEVVIPKPRQMEKASRWHDLRGQDRRDKPWLNGMPRLIFVSDMSDALSKDVPFSYLESEIIDEVTSPAGTRHEWLWLTKQARRMAAFSAFLKKHGREWPVNLWVGTSITALDPRRKPQGLARIAHLARVGDKNTLRFLSVEPQAGPIDLQGHLDEIDWVIQGGQSGKHAGAFDIEWARSMMAQCKAAGVPYFLKQLGASPIRKGKPMAGITDSHGGDWDEWPRWLRVRQMPRLRRRRR